MGKAVAIPAAIAIAVAAPVARACPDGTIAARLDREAQRAHRWDLAWGVAFGATAIAYGAMAETGWEFGLHLDSPQRDDLWIGTIKTAIAALSHVVVPLRIERAPGCADDAAAIHALEESARHERVTFWLSIAGGVALNGGGLLYLGVHDHAWGQGLISAGIGTPVAILHTWTMPLGARHPLADLHVAVAHRPDFTGVIVGGAF